MTKKESNVMEFRGINYKRFIFEAKLGHRCNSCDLQEFLDEADYPSECTCLDVNKGEVINSYYWKVI